MNMVPVWAEVVIALLLIAGAASAAVGAFGLVRLPTFFDRIHAPTLCSTFGVWAITLGTIVFFSVQGFNLFLHAILVNRCVALTAPITNIFLMRAALFRERQRGGRVPTSIKPEATPNPPVA